MAKIRITKEFVFDAAHNLPHYDGKCRNIHGHTYKLLVTLIGEPCSDIHSPKCGMVLDFSDLKQVIKESIVDTFDHALIVSADSNSACLKQFQEEGKFVELPFQPTCENLTVYIAELLLRQMPKNVQLYSVRLYETPTSYSEWVVTDNQ
ncbi:MAG: 6-carboxytetrahydropterin synthase QueD [Bacteroidales bacterium]|nr:6-carboxytetrahydropterin synthase QueD [Bacteroidales bacterium]